MRTLRDRIVNAIIFIVLISFLAAVFLVIVGRNEEAIYPIAIAIVPVWLLSPFVVNRIRAFIAVNLAVVVLISALLIPNQFTIWMFAAAEIYNSVFDAELVVGPIKSLLHGWQLVLAVSVLLFFLFYVDYLLLTERSGSGQQVKKHRRRRYDHISGFVESIESKLNDIDRRSWWQDQSFIELEAHVESQPTLGLRKRVGALTKTELQDRTTQLFIILGSPGSGKSVALRHLSRTMLKQSKLSGLVPLYINLGDWVPAQDWNSTNEPRVEDLVRFIRSSANGYVQSWADQEFFNRNFETMLKRGDLFLVFDSFDEIPAIMVSGVDSEKLIEQLSRVFVEFMQSYNSTRIVVASRLFRDPKIQTDKSKVFEIRPFDLSRISEALRKHPGVGTGKRRQLFREKQDLIPLARNPFTLGLLANYLAQNKEFPESRAELYRSYIDLRLDQVAERISELGVSNEIVLANATEIAVFLINEANRGLEVSTETLESIATNATHMRSTINVLTFAKLARRGIPDGNFSFVHRRFAEYFYVSSILHLDTASLPLNDIQYDGRYRDSLILLSEVIEERKANEIAQHCWKYIEGYENSDAMPGNELYRTRVNCLRFLVEAFRTRRSALGSLREKIERFVDHSVELFANSRRKESDKAPDLLSTKIAIEALALVNDVPSIRILISAFKLNEPWLNETALRSWRFSGNVPSDLLIGLRNHFARVPATEFFVSSREVLSSLALMPNLRRVWLFCYAKRIDFLLYMFGIAILLAVFPVLIVSILIAGVLLNFAAVRTDLRLVLDRIAFGFSRMLLILALGLMSYMILLQGLERFTNDPKVAETEDTSVGPNLSPVGRTLDIVIPSINTERFRRVGDILRGEREDVSHLEEIAIDFIDSVRPQIVFPFLSRESDVQNSTDDNAVVVRPNDKSSDPDETLVPDETMPYFLLGVLLIVPLYYPLSLVYLRGRIRGTTLELVQRIARVTGIWTGITFAFVFVGMWGLYVVSHLPVLVLLILLVLLFLFLDAFLAFSLIATVGFAIVLLGLFLRTLFSICRDYLVNLRIRAGGELNRPQISEHFNGFWTAFGRELFVLWLDGMTRPPLGWTPSGFWPGGSRPYIAEDDASNLLARLDERWITPSKMS